MEANPTADFHQLLPDSALDSLSFIFPRELKALHAVSIYTVGDVLRIAPRRYEDRRLSPPLSSLTNGESVCLQLRIYSAMWHFSYKRYYELSAGAADDPQGPRVFLRWFNMPYVSKLFAVGMLLSVFGKLRFISGKWTICNPDFEILDDSEQTGLRLAAASLGDPDTPGSLPAPQFIHTGRIVPIYKSVPGISARTFRGLVYRLLSTLNPDAKWEDFDPAPSYPMVHALRDLHFPTDDATAHKARMRFALSECFARQFAVAWQRRQTRAAPGLITVTTNYYCQELLSALPFPLTRSQQRCIDEIRADMARPTPMNRLLQGDVGSGKTLVALCAMLMCIESGKTAALLAPTQILAEQHYRNFRRLLQHTDVRLSLRTSDRADDSHLIADCVNISSDSSPRIIIGTHALLYEKNRPQNLGLAVIDEQHKFGVVQRQRFIQADSHPDVLVMTATPIPRTLTLTLYADLDVSIIDELPPGRGEIVTALRNPKHMKRIISFLRKEISNGRQVYIVSPLIEENENSERSSASQELIHWRAILPEFSIGLLHGKMSADEKEKAMADFATGITQVLVCTTVVEVGVDVANATVMIINDADSFGLSQLHQLRGRIGRGSHKSYCILLSTAKSDDPAHEKLEILCKTSNGFEIAEHDFRLRGPGDVLGTAQSGLGSVRFAEWISDVRLIHRATRIANSILDSDPALELPIHASLRRRMEGVVTQSVPS